MQTQVAQDLVPEQELVRAIVIVQEQVIVQQQVQEYALEQPIVQEQEQERHSIYAKFSETILQSKKTEPKRFVAKMSHLSLVWVKMTFPS